MRIGYYVRYPNGTVGMHLITQRIVPCFKQTLVASFIDGGRVVVHHFVTHHSAHTFIRPKPRPTGIPKNTISDETKTRKDMDEVKTH